MRGSASIRWIEAYKRPQLLLARGATGGFVVPSGVYASDAIEFVAGRTMALVGA